MTHLHIDHASAMSEFPNATFVFSAREWEAATEARNWQHGYRTRQFDHGFDYRTLDFEGAAGSDSYATFGRAFDLLGDGSIRAVYTPGHTHGHMSVVLRLAGEREALVAGDAIYTRHALETGHRPFRIEDEHLFGRSLREIQLYAEQTPDALVIPGHDMGAWRELIPCTQPASRPAPCPLGRPLRRRVGRAGRLHRVLAALLRQPVMVERLDRPANTTSEAACDWSREGFSTRSKRIGSPNCTVTFGNWSFFQLRTFALPAIAVGTTDAPVSRANRPTPGFGSPSRSVRDRPPSMYITITPPRLSTVRAVSNASSSRRPRSTGKTPPCVYTNCSGGVKSCDFAMKFTCRLMNAATKK